MTVLPDASQASFTSTFTHARTHTYIEGWLGSVTECKHSPFVFFPSSLTHFYCFLLCYTVTQRCSGPVTRPPEGLNPIWHWQLTADRLSTREVTLSDTHQTHLPPLQYPVFFIFCSISCLISLLSLTSPLSFLFSFSSFFSRHKPISHTDCHLQIDVLLLMLHSVWNLWLTLVWNLRKRIRTTGGEKVDTSFFSFPNSESLNFDFNLRIVTFFLEFLKRKKKVPSFFYFQWLQSSSVEICAALGKMFFSDCDITHFC